MKRPCKCGHEYKKHIWVNDLTLYCDICPLTYGWCYNYTPIGNLEYLEYLYEHTFH